MRRLGIVTDTEHQAVEIARAQVLAMVEEHAGPFADTDGWAGWRWDPAWPAPRLPRLTGGRCSPPGLGSS